MLAVNYSTLRNNLKEYCDKVTDDLETVIVTRKDEKNVVLMSLDDYNNIMENLLIMSNQNYYKTLIERKNRMEQDGGVSHNLIEVEE